MQLIRIATMRNHYVPQFLQRPWTGEDGRLHVFRKSVGQIDSFRQFPKGNGYEEDLLALTEDTVAGMDKHANEKVGLQIIDYEASKIRDRMDSGNIKSFSSQERYSWARFLVSLRLRQPRHVKMLREEAKIRLRKTLAEGPKGYIEYIDHGFLPTAEELVDLAEPGFIENFGLRLFLDFVSEDSIIEKINSLFWGVYDFRGGQFSLLLSDNPLIVDGGIDHPEAAMILPISPYKAFVATRGELTANVLSGPDLKALTGRLNELSLREANDRVFALDGSPRRFIENRWL
jgi:hypothetical protein